MKDLMKHIFKKWGFVPEFDVKMKELQLKAQWKRLLLNPTQLKREIMIAKAEKRLAKQIEKSFLGDGYDVYSDNQRKKEKRKG